MKDGRNRKTRCPYSKHCGGCTSVNIPYEEQISHREAKVQSCIGAYGPVEPIIRMKNPDHYRNKATGVFASDHAHGGRPICGIYEKNSHRVVDVEKCLLENVRADSVCRSILSLVPSFKIPIYDEDRGTGVLRYVQVRTARATREMMVTIVAATPVFPSKNNFVKALLKLQPDITTIVLNVNNRTDSMILGDRDIVLYGKGFIEDRLCGKTFRISPRSFYQINPIQTEKLYNVAIDMAGLSGRETILDAYCGIGTIGICAADRAKKVIGVEVNPEAVKDAQANARMNYGEKDGTLQEDKAKTEDAENKFEYINADAGKFMTQMAEGGSCPDVVFMDPPRAGASEDFLKALLKLCPRKIVYISCGPETLCRDLAVLCTGADYTLAGQYAEQAIVRGEDPTSCIGPAGGDLSRGAYILKKAVPVDMFPSTGHVETVAVLSRKSASKSFIPVSISPKDMGLSEEKEQPTYANICDYVQKTHGMKVSSLYVAQMKAECGLETQADRSGDKKQPKCPPEKREAILDAFRHFGLIGEDETEK